MNRVYLAIIALLVVVLGIVLWSDHATSYEPRPKTLAELQALPEELLARQAVDDLALRAFAPGAPRDAWTRFNEPSRHVFVLAVVESGCDGPGLAGFAREHAQDAGFPRLEDARDACAAIGLDDATKILEAALAGHDQPAATAAWLGALRQPAAVERRLDYVRRNLALIARPMNAGR